MYGQCVYTWIFYRITVSLAVGTYIGVACDFSARFDQLLKTYLKLNLAEVLTSGILLFCFGTFSLEEQVMCTPYGDNTYLLTHDTLYFVNTTVIASIFGWGMVFAAPALFVLQGTIYLLPLLVRDLLSDRLRNEISINVGALIACSGFSILMKKNYYT